MDDHGVGGRDIKPAFHDGGGQQHIILAVIKGVHDVIEFPRRHLPVRHHGFYFRHIFFEEGIRVGEVRDARAHIKALAAAIALAQQRFADHHRIKRRDESAHSQPVHRRRRDEGQFPHTGERQLQGARNGRRRQRQHMHVRLELLELFLVGHAKALFLVHNQQAQILEPDRLGQERMGTHDNVQIARRHGLAGLLRFPGCNHAR